MKRGQIIQIHSDNTFSGKESVKCIGKRGNIIIARDRDGDIFEVNKKWIMPIRRKNGKI